MSYSYSHEIRFTKDHGGVGKMVGTVKFFSDVDGGAVELRDVHGLLNAAFAREFPGVSGRMYDSFTKQVGYPADGPKRLLPVSRVVNYKAFPSKHVCDARCMYARGKTMNCECSCGGKNHGKGNTGTASLKCEAA